MYVISFKCKISMPHHPEMLAEHEGRARASTLHFSRPESRGMLSVKFLHLYVFLLRRTLPRNGQGFPEPQNRLTFSTSIVQTATAKLLFAPLSREHSIKLWFKANIKGDMEPFVPFMAAEIQTSVLTQPRIKYEIGRAPSSIPDITPMGHPTTEVLCYNLWTTEDPLFAHDSTTKNITQ